MKNACKLMMMMVMFIGTAVADGDMGAGGRTCPQNCPVPTPTPFAQNQTGNNGNKEESDVIKRFNEEKTRILVEVIWFLNRLF